MKRNPHTIRSTELKLIPSKLPASPLEYYSPETIITWDSRRCRTELSRLDGYRYEFMSEISGGDLIRIAAFNRYYRSIKDQRGIDPDTGVDLKQQAFKRQRAFERQRETERKRSRIIERNRRLAGSLKTTSNPIPIQEVHSGDCGFDSWVSIHKEADVVIMSKADFAIAEATFDGGGSPPEPLSNDSIGPCDGEPSNLGIPNEIMAEAIINDGLVGIDLLALGKPGGGIFNPDHWMFDQIRDHFGSVLRFDSNKMTVA